MAILKKLEFMKLNACRFIGKSVYATPGSSEIGGLWGDCEKIFMAIDHLKEYATDEIHNAALITWDKYEEQNKLMGYTIGKFMKMDTPVPEGLDFIDLPDTFVAKGWIEGEFDDVISNAEALTKEAAKKQNEYTLTSWEFMAEVYTKEPTPEDGENYVLGYYIACKEKHHVASK